MKSDPTASRSSSNRSAYVSSVTLAEVCPSMRCRARTLTLPEIASEAYVCRGSCGVIFCTMVPRLHRTGEPSACRLWSRHVPSIGAGEHQRIGGCQSLGTRVRGRSGEPARDTCGGSPAAVRLTVRQRQCYCAAICTARLHAVGLGPPWGTRQ